MSMSKMMKIPTKSLWNFYRCHSNAVVPDIRSSLATIRVPKYVNDFIERRKKKEFAEQLNKKSRGKTAYRGDTSIPVISSNIGEYNHYLGQIYKERFVLPLQSRYWFKAKSSGQKFTINPYSSNPSLPLSDPQEHVDDVYLPNEFSKMNLSDTVVQTLTQNFNFIQPARIQTLVIPRILTEQHTLIASEAGSGKTIAYLAPIIDKLASHKRSMELFPDTPLGLIVVPGRELAEQVADVAYNLGLPSGVNVRLLIAEGTKKEHLSLYPNEQVDLLVATVGSLVKLFKRNKIHLANLKFLVLDEADTLLDNSFIDLTTYLFRRSVIKLRDSNYGTQLILSSTIYPSNLSAILSDELQEKDFLKVCSMFLHRIPFHVQQRFWRVSEDGRAGEVLALVKEDYTKKKPVLIFCNKSPTCNWLHKFLEENGIPNGEFHGGMSNLERTRNFHKFQSGDINVLCCTDVASRGLDTQRVKHVINFDFPNNQSDYLLRVGRVGRVGSNQGKVTSLVVSKPGVYAVNTIETAVRKAERLSNVDSNIKQKIKDLYFTFGNK